MRQSLYEKSLFIGDLHIPFQDPLAVKVMLKFTDWFKPHVIFIIGDLLDWYQLSKFDKNPTRILKIQDDIDETQHFLAELRTHCPKARIVYFEGNHEKRLTKYLWSHPEIASLKVLSVEFLLNLSPLKIEFVPQNQRFKHHGFKVEHGDIARKHSGYTARGMMEDVGISGISGHSHRLGAHYKTNEGGDFVWLENGCLCDKNPEYIVGLPNWQSGFTIGYYKRGDNRFSVEQICVTKNKAAFAGKEFNSD